LCQDDEENAKEICRYVKLPDENLPDKYGNSPPMGRSIGTTVQRSLVSAGLNLTPSANGQTLSEEVTAGKI